MENNRTLHQDSLNHLAEKTASAFLSKADSEPKLKSAQTEFILVRRNKAGLSCLSGFRKDRPVWAPRIQLAQRFRGEDSLKCGLHRTRAADESPPTGTHRSRSNPPGDIRRAVADSVRMFISCL